MSSYDNSECTPYRRTRRGEIPISSTSEVSSECTSYQQTQRGGIPIPSSADSKSELKERSPRLTSPTGDVSNSRNLRTTPGFLTLVQYIANALDTLPLSSEASLEISSVPRQPPEFIGRGKTFCVSRAQLPPGIELERSWPRKLLVLQPLSSGPSGMGNGMIVRKIPVIEFGIDGNPKDKAGEEALKAVILEIQVLTHKPLYFHKNIVDFLGVSWECELLGSESGRTSTNPLKRIPVILLEYAQHGSLVDLQHTELYATMSFNGKASLCRDVAEGLAALHRCGIVHGDIKPDNILIFDAYDSDGNCMTSGLRAKLADFGFSVQGSSKDDTDSSEATKWKLTGRTWPWNAPEWDLARSWSQLQKTDVFSYGLLAWTILTGKEVEILFDAVGRDIKRDDVKLRKRVEELKDWTLSCNAASYFRENDKLVRLLVECLFRWSLDPIAENRGTIKDVLEIWNTWFTEDDPYESVPPGMHLDLETNITDTAKRIRRAQFRHIIRSMADFPPSVKKEFADVHINCYGSSEQEFKAIIFRAFCHIIGWGIQQDPREGKRLIDKAAELSLSAAIFQPMFFDGERELGVRSPSFPSHENCTAYEAQAFGGLYALLQNSNSHEASQQLLRYFPLPAAVAGFYSQMRSTAYRKYGYGIDTSDDPIYNTTTAYLDVSVIQLADIEQNYQRRDVIKRKHNRLHFAVFSGFAAAIGIVLRSADFDPRSLEEQDYNGDTPLLAACRLGAFSIARLLIHAGANVNARNHYNETTLHFLTEFDNHEHLAEIADLIFARGSEGLIHTKCANRSSPQEQLILIPDSLGPPLNCAILRNNPQLVSLLLKHGAYPQRTPRGDTPSSLILAASGHFIEILKLLWEACPQAEVWRGSELLSYAVWGFLELQRMYFHGSRAKEMMKRTFDFLLEKELSKRPSDISDHGTLLYSLVRHGSVDMVEHILSKVGTAEINAYSGRGTPLHQAIASGSNEKFTLLLKYGADPHLEFQTQYLISSLTYCCMHWGGTSQMVKRLLELGVDTGNDNAFITALTGAILTDNFETAFILLDAGANINQVNDQGFTTLGAVLTNGAENTVARLEFLLDYPITIGKNPASFLINPKKGITALHIAASWPALNPLYNRATLHDVLDYLLHKFSTPRHLNAQEENGLTPLHIAAGSCNPIAVQILFDYKLNLNLRSRNGKTAHQCVIDLIVGKIPRAVEERGYRAVRVYKKEVLEVRNLFAKKVGEKEDWVVAIKLDEFSMNDGTGRIGHVMVVADDEGRDM